MSKLRVVSYAINGRGIGHLVRQLAILRWVKRITALLDVPCECWVLTSSEADTLARREGIPAFKMPSKAMMRDAAIEPSRHLAVARTWTMNIIAGLQPDLLLVDTFPGGSFGELIAALELVPHRVLVARRVRESVASDPAYAALLPLYEQHIEPDARGTGPILIREREELLPRQDARAALGIAPGDRAVYVTLGGGGDLAAPFALPRLVQTLRERGWHLVVGAGPLYQGTELRGPKITWIDRYVPMELFAGLDAAVSAGGYNSFHELMYCGVPTVFLPQPRISDDQGERAARAAAAGAGRLAPSVEQVAALLEDPGDPAAARSLVPSNGARTAALQALASVLPEADLALARRVLSPALLARGATVGGSAGAQKVLEIVRVLAGGPPREVARRRELMAELSERGVDVSALDAELGRAEPVERFLGLTRQHEVPLDTAVALLKSLQRKFPAASASELVEGSVVLLGAWARFRDWMGAVSLLRAVPTQRGLSLASFAAAMRDWLAGEDDLFDALRAFAQLEQDGARPVAEVLRLLTTSRAGAAARPDRNVDGDRDAEAEL
ncbi:MAG TPA: hypothetical protein VML75_13710 [Kofleriaceae bacterium]|nr:hypothetical protein [Kofleriaceae bacterium]